MKVYLSYGGGVNSTALLISHEREIDEAVYVDHGGDYPETREYVRWLRDKQGFPITIIQPEVEGFNNIYDFCMAKKIIPSRLFRWCTGKFKLAPLKKYIQPEAMCYVGFCKGEEKRTKSEFKLRAGIYGKYPLMADGVDREGCKQIILDAGLPIPRKSCCFFCPFQRVGEARELYLNYPDLFQKCKALEENCMREDWYIQNRPIGKIGKENIPAIESYI